MPESIEKLCLNCGNTFRGRGDKKYCSDQCRSTHHNKLNSYRANPVRTVNNILRKNRRILCKLNPGGKAKVHHERLRAEGFNFSYHTSTFVNQSGAQYHFCYEQGYRLIENDYYLLVIKQEH